MPLVDSIEEWDPYAAFETERALFPLLTSRESFDSSFPTYSESNLGFLRSRSRTLSQVRCGPATTYPSHPIVRRRLVTMSSPLASSETKTLESSCPVLPPVDLKTKWRVSLVGSRDFALSFSEYGNASELDRQSLSTEQDHKTTEFLEVNLDPHPVKNSFSKPGLRNVSSCETVVDRSVVDFIKFSDHTQPATPSTLCQTPLHLSEENHKPPTSHLPRDSVTQSDGGPIINKDRTVTDNAPLFPAPQPQESLVGFSLPKSSSDRLRRARRTSNWLPPSEWAFDTMHSPKDSKDSSLWTKPSRRPVSTFYFGPDMRVRQGQATPPPCLESQRPRSAPHTARSPLTGDKSSHGALEKRPKFHRTALPTHADLEAAAKLDVISESGIRVPFGTLFHDKKTIVVFIRHFWCRFCQDYMYSVNSSVSPDMLSSRDVNLVVVGNGSHGMIKAYRSTYLNATRVFHCRLVH
jgi:hypothetical protein